MQSLRKTKKAGFSRKWLILAALAAIALLTAGTLLLSREPQQETLSPASTSQDLFAYAREDVAVITIRRGDEDPWTVRQEQEGLLTLAGEDGFTLSESKSYELLDAACILPCEAVLTENAAEYRDHLADFGLDEPKYEAIITYADGVTAHLSIGSAGGENGEWYYMTVAGDERLFSFSKGMVDALFISRDSLRTVEQPVIHKARIDHVTLESQGGVIEWALQGDITDADTADKWRLLQPFPYPADATAMENLLKNLANLRLGAYVAPAAPENLTAYGFDEPRLTLRIHMAAGTIAVNQDGAAQATDFPESEVTFVIGGAKDDMVDYVRYGDAIYVSSHFTMGVFIDYDAAATMSRYPVMTALGNLAALRIEQEGIISEYVLTRTEQVAQNNELVTDEDGNTVYDVTVSCNGEALDYAAFEAAYDALCLVKVSGTLPSGEFSAMAAHTTYVFTDVDGTVHTVALCTFDALHDAVEVDGHQAFYLIKGGFSLDLD